ncbi:MAG: hypothetical protein Q4F49_07330 [Pseudoxanthomonas suwonensis]|nr:hypothetical protein [Pseudoxanthomonas suwonensis]
MLLVVVLALAACGGQAPFARLAGVIVNGELRELSGMAASRQHDGVLWVHNDGGHAPVVYAISPRGRVLARLHVDGVTKTDWEDMAAFEQDGRHYLLIADTGDNGGLRRTLQLHVIEEPAAIADARVHPLRTLTFRWPDGPRDCEAVAVDAAAGRILLVSKKQRPPELFSLPLDAPPGEVHVARLLGHLQGVPGPAPSAPDPRLAKVAGQVTAADISPDGRELAVMTYRDVLFYPRAAGEEWATAVARPPRSHRLPTLLPQAEALAWSAGGSGLFATGEFSPAPLFWLRPAEPDDDTVADDPGSDGHENGGENPRG